MITYISEIETLRGLSTVDKTVHFAANPFLWHTVDLCSYPSNWNYGRKTEHVNSESPPTKRSALDKLVQFVGVIESDKWLAQLVRHLHIPPGFNQATNRCHKIFGVRLFVHLYRVINLVIVRPSEYRETWTHAHPHPSFSYQLSPPPVILSDGVSIADAKTPHRPPASPFWTCDMFGEGTAFKLRSMQGMFSGEAETEAFLLTQGQTLQSWTQNQWSDPTSLIVRLLPLVTQYSLLYSDCAYDMLRGSRFNTSLSALHIGCGIGEGLLTLMSQYTMLQRLSISLDVLCSPTEFLAELNICVPQLRFLLLRSGQLVSFTGLHC